MNKLLFFYIIFLVGWNSSAQNLQLLISGNSPTEERVIDSIGYLKTHSNAKSISDEVSRFTDKLTQDGFLENKIINSKKSNDSTFVFRFLLGKKINDMHVYIGNVSAPNLTSLFSTKNDTLVMRFSDVAAFMKSTLNKLEKKGFALSKLQLIHLQKKQTYWTADLQLNTEKKRALNDIVFNGYKKFPYGFQNNLKRRYKNQVFNQDNLRRIFNDLNKIQIIKQTKYPEILFTKDSTKIYVYLEKAKSNTFDGFIGFSNDDKNKIIFNGYVDLVLNNALNNGEKFALYWKSDGKDQKTLNVGLDIPYIFKSPLGIKAQLNIFKQDSTFQNTKTALNLGYFFNYNSKVYLGYQATESNDIKNVNSNLLSDYKNSYLTSSYEFLDYDNEDYLFPEKTNFNLKFGSGKRYTINQTNQQFFGNLTVYHHFYLNKKNAIALKSQNFYLKSDAYIINELERFGGINSIRGFNENSLQANVFTSLLTEYQYLLAPSIYVHTLFDYGYFQDQTSKRSGKLLGLGFGFGIITKNGLFNLVYANGSTNDQAIKLSNSIVHISLKTNF